MKVGFIGLGLMGTPMAVKLREAGHDVIVWGRRPEALKPLLDIGAQSAASPKDVAAECEMIFLCVTDTAAVEAVVFGDDGVASGGEKGKILVDHSSIRPDATREFASRLMAVCGMDWLDGPVSGGPLGVERGTLVVMLGGEQEAFDRAEPVMRAYAGGITLMGPSGAGQATKLVNQALCGANMMLLAEVTRFAQDSGVDVAKIPGALKGGRADSVVLQDFMPRMAAREFEPMGTIDIMLKDLQTVLEFAKQTGSTMPLTALTAQLHHLLSAQGHGGEDNAALIRLYDTGSD